MTIFEILGKVIINTDDAEKKIKDTQKSAKSFGQNLGKFFVNGVKVVGKATVAAVGAASAAVTALGKIGIDYNTQMETYTTNFEVMLGDAAAAAQKVEELKKFASSTPFSMDDLAQGTQTLLAFNVANEESTGILRMLGDISLGSAEKLQRLTNAYGKINSTGKLTGETLQQMIEAGFNPALVITEKTGETMEEFQKRLSAGKVSAEELTEAMAAATSEGGQFFQGMEKASQTTAGLISTLKDNATALIGEVFKPISESIRTELLPSAIDGINELTTAFKEDGVDGLIDAAGNLIGEWVGKIAESSGDIVKVGLSLVNSLIEGIVKNFPTIIPAAVQTVTTLSSGILQMLPAIIAAGLQLIIALANGIAQSLPELIPTIVDVVLQIADTLTDPANIEAIINAAVAIITGLAVGIINALPKLIEKAPEIILKLNTSIIEAAPMLASAAAEMIVTLAQAIVDNFPEIIEKGKETVASFISGLYALLLDVYESGIKIINNILDGIKEKFPEAYSKGTEVINKITDGISSLLSSIKEKGSEIINEIIDGIKEKFPDVYDVGSKVVDKIKEGISSAWDGLKSWFQGIWNSLFGNLNTTVTVNKKQNGGTTYTPTATGLDYVPYNNYPAFLHEGEAVLTASQAEAWRKGNGSGSGNGIVINQYISSPAQTPVQLAAATSAYFEQARWAI